MTPQAQLRFGALGGEVELVAIGPAEPLEDTAAWILRLHGTLTRFDPSSELARLNARAGEWVEVSQALAELLSAALDAYVLTDGLVHAGVLPHLVALGYDRTFAELPRRTEAPHRAPPPPAPLPEMLEVKRGRARLSPNAAVDLGGIAKGWIADRAAERLGANALVSCGGDLFARGGGESGEGWPVGLGGETLLLRDMGAATSGTRKRRWGERLHHLIDPRTGLPADTGVVEASVVAGSALDAEALAKAALLLGPAAAPAWLEGRALAWRLA